MMDKWIRVIISTLLISSILPASFAGNVKKSDSLTPVGYWKTIDDVSGKPKSILQITKGGNQSLSGRVLKTFAVDNKEPSKICSKCPGARHNQPIIGMVIMENLKQDTADPTQWTGGEILDPKSGKVYHCTLKVLDGGQKLNVRGYVGLPMFGRTQTWIRVSKPD